MNYIEKEFRFVRDVLKANSDSIEKLEERVKVLESTMINRL